VFITDKVTPELRKITIGAGVLTGQTSIAVTNTAVQMSTNTSQLKNGVIVQALSGNSDSIYIGASGVTTSTGFELQAGQATSLATDKLSNIYVNGTSGDGICYIAIK